MQYGGGSKDYEKFPMLDAEWDFVSAALPRLLQGENARLQGVCVKLMQFFNFTGRWDERISVSEQAEARALAADDKENAGWRAYDTGWIYYLRNQPELVLACASRAASHWTESPARLKATAIQLRGLGHKLQKDYPAAIAAYREAVEIDRSISPESADVSIDLDTLATAEKMTGDDAAAERDYREALRIAKKVNYEEGVAYITGNLAVLALAREQWAEAESLAREALPLAEKVGRQELIASDCGRIAKALLEQNRATDEALSLSRRAVEIFTRLRMSDYLQTAQKTLAEIEQARGGK
jgi:tetratricopeptide (TPR) repeat protein